MAGTFPDGWTETALVTIQIKGGTARQFAAITETIDISEGDYPGESVQSVAGGRMWKQSSEEDGEITLELYPIELETAADNTGLFQPWVGGTWDTGGEPLQTDITWTTGARLRDRFIVGILWTTDESATSALAQTSATDKTALRYYAKECRITSHKSSFTDGILKITATFKYPAYNKAGTTKSSRWESTDDTDTSVLPAITYS